jgi:hypothetical protein
MKQLLMLPVLFIVFSITMEGQATAGQMMPDQSGLRHHISLDAGGLLDLVLIRPETLMHPCLFPGESLGTHPTEEWALEFLEVFKQTAS